jgi:hypothetical protein
MTATSPTITTARQVAEDIRDGYGVEYSLAELRAAMSTIIRATGQYDMNTNPDVYRDYLIIARYERSILQGTGWRVRP